MKRSLFKSDTNPTAVELFAGAGLFSYAFKIEGFTIVQAIEINKVAAETYSANIGHEIECRDVRACDPKVRCDVLLAGPPCQGFSTLGKQSDSDPRNELSHEVVRWARLLTPSIVVIENVAAFLETRVWNKVHDALAELGYEVSATVLNAHDFGVPQMRVRSFTIASKIGLPSIIPPKKKRANTVREAWEGLSLVPDGENNHYAPHPSPLALARMRVIPLGGDKRDVMRLAPRLAPPSWRNVTTEVTDVWGRLHWDRPSNTLRTALQNPSKGRYIHPEQDRVISLREAARLHSIPDEWVFKGLPTQIARQIGNSVPPALGRAVASAVRWQFNHSSSPGSASSSVFS